MSRTRTSGLTPREADIAKLIAEGYRDPEIAERLGVSVKTVSTLLGRAFMRAGVHTRLELAAWWTDQEAAS